MNGVQLFSNISIPLLNISFSIVFLASIVQFQDFRKIIAWLIFVLFLGINFPYTLKSEKNYALKNLQYEQETLQVLKKLNNKMGVAILGNADFKGDMISLDFMAATLVGNHLAMQFSNFHAILIGGIDEAPLDKTKPRYQQDISQFQNTTFFRFVERQKKENTFQSIEQSQIDFIEKYKISYALVSPNAKVSSLLQKRVLKEFKDQVSGERFLLLDNQ